MPVSNNSAIISASNSAQSLIIIRDRIKSRTRTFRYETGLDLIRAKEILPHGEFGPWLTSNFGWSESTAQSLMNAAKAIAKSPEIGVLAPSAIMTLAAPNTPATVKSEVMADLASGKIPTNKEIKAKIASAKPAKTQAKKKSAEATLVTLPVTETRDSAAAPSVEALVSMLQAAGVKAARIAFETAFPGYVVTDFDELQAELTRLKAA